MRTMNLGVRFALELALLASVTVWGFGAAEGVLGWVLGLGAPTAAGVVWGLFVSPKARIRVATPLRLLIEAGAFGAGALALWGSGRPALALAFALLAAASSTVNHWPER